MVDKGLTLYKPSTGDQQIEVSVEPDPQPEGVEIIVDGEEQDEEPSAPLSTDHSDNLAEFLDEDVLTSLSIDLRQLFEQDKLSRAEWERMYTNGLDYMGIKHEDRNKPWPGACGIHHPMIAEAVVRFQSNAIMEIFPEDGPVRTKILGKISEEREEQAQRVQDYMNYCLTEEIPEYRLETEKLLFALPLAGSAFRKVYYDTATGYPQARFVPAEDFIMPWGSGSLCNAPRFTEVMRPTRNDVRRLQASGLWRDVDLGEPVDNYDTVQDKKDKLNREQSVSLKVDHYTVMEMNCYLEIPGYEDPDGLELPYIVTFEYNTGKVLAIYRNWDESDDKKLRRLWYAQYNYIPGLGAYGYGLIHLMGSLARGATSILRQLIDAGTLANLPGGFKTKGLRVKDSDSPIGPGEWRDVDSTGAKLADSLMPLPYKEPSAVLLALLDKIVDEGRRMGSIADLDVNDIGSQAPVGTTLAIMERALKVMSAVQARLHASLHEEFKILVRVISENMPDPYPYDVEGGSREIKKEDFDDRIDVVPVSNPNAATMAQRLVQYQIPIQLSAQAPPGTYDIPRLHREIMRAAGIKDVDSIIPRRDILPLLSPDQENSFIITGKPVKVFEEQDHDAHLQTHLTFSQDPSIQQMLGQNPQAQSLFATLQSHIAEHVAMKYRNDLAKRLGVPLPGLGEPLPADVESALSLSVAQASEKLLSDRKAEEAQKKAEQVQQDPVFQLQMQELEVKKADVAQKAQANQGKLQIEAAKLQANTQTEMARIQSQASVAGQNTQAMVMEQLKKLQLDQERFMIEANEIKARTAKILAEIAQMGNQPEGNNGPVR